MRAHLVAAMIAVAVTGVALTGVLVTRAVDAELAGSARRDLRLSAINTARIAADIYLEAGGWSQRSIRALRAVARSRGDTILVLGDDGRPLDGAPTIAPAGGRVSAAIIVNGRRIGTVVARHQKDHVGVVDSQLAEQVNRLLVRAGLLAGLLALLVALTVGIRMARPLQRLTEVARRIEAGDLDTRATGSRGAREIALLGGTMDRLAAALRRQDEVRRATAADVTHELRGALVGVFSRIDALQHGLIDDKPTVFTQMERDAHRLRRLVNDVHRLAEAQRPALFMDKRPIALDQLVRERVAGHAEQFRARSVSLNHAVQPVIVAGDRERLAQVLDNLLANALRYTDPGGRVTACAGVRDGEAVIEVTDSGIGIAPEYLARVFDRFWRAPDARVRATDGSGVGLALVSELVRGHGGAVEVSSRIGHGTSFRVRLPLAERVADAPRSEARIDTGSDGRDLSRAPAALGPAQPAVAYGGFVNAALFGRDAALDRPDVSGLGVHAPGGAAGR